MHQPELYVPYKGSIFCVFLFFILPNNFAKLVGLWGPESLLHTLALNPKSFFWVTAAGL